jgi:hypothetical protein
MSSIISLHRLQGPDIHRLLDDLLSQYWDCNNDIYLVIGLSVMRIFNSRSGSIGLWHQT